LALGCGLVTAFAALAWMLFGRVGPAVLAACLATAHPAGIEVFVWISGLGEVLSDLFVVCGVALGLLCIGPTPVLGGRLRIGAAVLSVMSLVVSLFAKEKGVALPALLLAATISALLPNGFERAALTREPGRSAARRAAILITTQGVLVLAYAFLWRPLLLGHGLALPAPMGGSVFTHLASTFGSWPASLLWLFVPASSSTSDVVQLVTSAADPMPWLGLGLAAGSLVAWLVLLRAGRPVAALGLAWIWIAFLPTSNLLPQLHGRAERYLFLSVFGVALLVVDLLALASDRLPRRARAAAFATAGIVLVALLAQRSFVRTPAWQSTRSLFEADVARDPRFREGREQLALALFGAGRHVEAAEHLAKLTAEPSLFAGTSSFVNPVGVEQLYCQNQLALGRAAEVLARQERLRATQPALANVAGVRACFGQAQEALGRPQEALAIYLEIAHGLPGEPPPALSLLIARAHATLGNRAEASKWLERARRTGPREPAFHRQLDAVERLLRPLRAG
jgi:tetratricopeptide (TPR) repeat protein